MADVIVIPRAARGVWEVDGYASGVVQVPVIGLVSPSVETTVMGFGNHNPLPRLANAVLDCHSRRLNSRFSHKGIQPMGKVIQVQVGVAGVIGVGIIPIGQEFLGG